MSGEKVGRGKGLFLLFSYTLFLSCVDVDLYDLNLDCGLLVR